MGHFALSLIDGDLSIHALNRDRSRIGSAAQTEQQHRLEKEETFHFRAQQH
ncbi:hypothetical protein SynBIOSE41_04072 [Synechococcus sp. BIOS-E4-1]|nr:hypothetical protein SynBIOSE41_04072 [Synechococcus sp. BIOS-E4-1]